MNNATQGSEKTNATNLRQADSILSVEGVLSEKTLELALDNEGKEVIKGSLVIQTSDINFITVNVYMNKLTKAGKENGAFKGMMTVLEQYKSIAEVGVEEATKVRVTNGVIAPNTYFDERGQHDVVRYTSNFFNRIKDGDAYNPKAEFEIEVFIQSIIEEVTKDGDTTGRLLINGLLPTFNGIEPIQFVVPQEIADAVGNAFDIGETVKFFGDVVNSRVTKTIEIPVAIGKPQTKTTTTFKNEFVITGASEAYEEGVSVAAPYDIEVIKKAMAEREAALEEKKAKSQSGTSSTPKAQASGKPKPTNRALPF